MRKFDLLIIPILLLTMLISCNSDETIEGYKSNEIIVVSLDIEDDLDIDKIKLFTDGGTDSILKNEIGEKTSIKLKAPQKGEGLFSICVYTSIDTLCSDYFMWKVVIDLR